MQRALAEIFGIAASAFLLLLFVRDDLSCREFAAKSRGSGRSFGAAAMAVELCRHKPDAIMLARQIGVVFSPAGEKNSRQYD